MPLGRGWSGVGPPPRFPHLPVSPQLKQAEWAPDFGPSSFVPSWGATATGARKFLLAFNINLLSTKEQAHRIALNLREQGRGKDQVGSWRLQSHEAWPVPVESRGPPREGQGWAPCVDMPTAGLAHLGVHTMQDWQGQGSRV